MRSHEELDVTLALVPRTVDQLSIVVDREVWSEESHRGERQGANFHCDEYLRKAPRSTRRLDPVVRGTFGEMEHLRAVGEQRRASLAKVQTPRVDLHQRAKHGRRCRSFAGDQPFGLGEEVIVSERLDSERFRVHEPLYHGGSTGLPPAAT